MTRAMPPLAHDVPRGRFHSQSKPFRAQIQGFQDLAADFPGERQTWSA
jgi:hypothetical protein